MAEVVSGPGGAPSAEEADRELREMMGDPDFGVVVRRAVALMLRAYGVDLREVARRG